jgi:fibronectin type 3 domain-containing protein
MKQFLRIVMIVAALLCPCILSAEDTQPRGLRAISGDQAVYLHWSAPKGGAAGYWIYRALPDGDYQRLNTQPVEKPFYADRKVINGQFYWYVVTAVNQGGKEGARSKEVAAKPSPEHGPLRGY